MNLTGLDLGGSVVGGPGSMKDIGSQQSRFKWMMEGQSSPDTASPENAFHKNGEWSVLLLSIDLVFFIIIPLVERVNQ